MAAGDGRALIGITSDVLVCDGRERVGMYPAHAKAVVAAGGAPVLLTHEVESIPAIIDRLDGFILTGGDDPAMEAFGAVTDSRVTLVNPKRQAFEVALLRALAEFKPDAPVLGVCLGMQIMALTSGGALDQYLPDTTGLADGHWEKEHAIIGEDGWGFGGAGAVLSRHKQAVADAGSMRVVARAPDGLIEAVDDPTRRFCLGVQWHPERTTDRDAGAAIFEALVAAV
jgi:putative glutamine amidotransferase